jgi:hypothetical protein
MLIALLYTLAFLPALIAIFGAKPRLREAGQPWAAPLDRFLLERRTVLRWLFLAVAIAAGVMTARLRFDADPLSLKDPRSESMVALGELMDQPAANPYTATILAPSLPAAEQLGARLAELPEVNPDGVMTLASFVPEDQDGKLAILNDLQLLLGPALSPVDQKAPPTPDETRQALATLAGKVKAATVLPPDVRDPLAAGLERLAKSDDAEIARAQDLLLGDLLGELDQLRDGLRRDQHHAPVAGQQALDLLEPDLATADHHAAAAGQPQAGDVERRVEHALHARLVADALAELTDARLSGIGLSGHPPHTVQRVRCPPTPRPPSTTARRCAGSSVIA